MFREPNNANHLAERAVMSWGAHCSGESILQMIVEAVVGAPLTYEGDPN